MTTDYFDPTVHGVDYAGIIKAARARARQVTPTPTASAACPVYGAHRQWIFDNVGRCECGFVQVYSGAHRTTEQQKWDAGNARANTVAAARGRGAPHLALIRALTLGETVTIAHHAGLCTEPQPDKNGRRYCTLVQCCYSLSSAQHHYVVQHTALHMATVTMKAGSRPKYRRGNDGP